MADLDDVRAAEGQVSTTLVNLQAEGKDTELILSTRAVCESILAVGIRLDYVLRDIAKTFYNAVYAGR